MRLIKLVTTNEIINKDSVRCLLRVIETNKLHTDLYRSIESYQDDIFEQIKKKMKSFGPVSKYQVFVFGTHCVKIKDVPMFLIQRLLTSL